MSDQVLAITYLILGFVSIFSNDLSVLETATGTQFWIPVLAIVLILILLYTILSKTINGLYGSVANAIKDEETKINKSVSKSYRVRAYIYTYVFCILLISAIQFGIVFLVMHVILKVW